MDIAYAEKRSRAIVCADSLRVHYFIVYREKDGQFALALGAERFIRRPIEPDAFMRLHGDCR